MLGHGSPSLGPATAVFQHWSEAAVRQQQRRRSPRWALRICSLAIWTVSVWMLVTAADAQQLELGNPKAKPGDPKAAASPKSPAKKPATESTDPAKKKTPQEDPLVEPAEAAGEQKLLDLDLRLAWGGEKAQAWQGQIQISAGNIQLIRTLGMEADQSRAFIPEGRTIHIQQLATNTFHGLDIAVRAPESAMLRVFLTPVDSKEDPQTLKIPLSSLVQETVNATLGQEGNRIQVHRTPGDRLRVNFQRDTLVFAPQEKFPLTITLHELGLEAGTSLRCELQLQSNQSSKTIFKSKHDLEVNTEGQIPTVGPLTIAIPDDEGVYDLHLLLYQKTLTGAFLPSKPLHRRSLQLVVIAPQPEAPEPAADFSAPTGNSPQNANWTQLVSIDPANPAWWKRITQLRQLSMIPGMGNGPVNNGKIQQVVQYGQTLTQLSPGGWVAYPLPIELVNQTHLLELNYPQDIRQTLSISIIDPNLAGKVAPIGLDSGIDVPASRQPATTKMAIHRMPFWPRTKTPWVLLVNRHSDRSAVFGKLNILQGNRPLPPATSITKRPSQRLVTAYFDKPLFPENFGAREGIDTTTRSSLDDWITFYDGADRLTRYLRFAGYNAAVISVMCEGATLYPSRTMPGTPKYDSGVFFTNGQDPVRKDVLEMLLRKFDQRGLTLIPAIQFSSPLPALEKQLKQEHGKATGIELIGEKGTSWVTTESTRRGMAPYYNPTDPRVQQAMQRVIDELVERYHHHPSFGGLAIQMGPETYTQLPGPQWGLDAHTFERFLQATNAAAANKNVALKDRLQYLNGPNRQKWLAWRGQVLADFYQNVSKRLQAKKADSRLYLVTTDLITSPLAKKQLQPRLPQQHSLGTALLDMGIDHRRFGDSEHLVLVRPQRLAPIKSLPAQAINLAMESSSQIDQIFADDRHSGQLFYHEPQSLSLPDFDKQSPFGANNTQTWLISHFSAAGRDQTRQFVHAIATSDIQTLMFGGWMLPIGQEDSLRSLFTTFQHLPNGKFTTVSSGGAKKTNQPVVIRTLKKNSETYIYLVNDSSWPVQVELELDADEQCLVMPLGTQPVSNLQRSASATTWTLALKPYDLMAASFTSPSVKIKNVRVRYNQQVLKKLQREIYAMNYRVSELNKPKPLNILLNPSFELPLKKGISPGWVHSRKQKKAVKLDREIVHDGRQALHLKRSQEDSDVVWVRSEAFPPPKTGRIAISAWLKVKDEKTQPALRLAIEGRQFGKVYYRPKTIGTNEPGNKSQVKPIGEKWTEFLLLIDDLPARGLSELRVGFDLMSEGEVWIDNIKVYDLWFQESEKRELLKHIALAYNQRSELKVGDCERFLTSYWARFLTQHIPLNQPRVAKVPAKVPTKISQPKTVKTTPAQPDSVAPKPKPSMVERIKGWIPEKVFPF